MWCSVIQSIKQSLELGTRHKQRCFCYIRNNVVQKTHIHHSVGKTEDKKLKFFFASKPCNTKMNMAQFGNTKSGMLQWAQESGLGLSKIKSPKEMGHGSVQWFWPKCFLPCAELSYHILICLSLAMVRGGEGTKPQQGERVSKHRPHVHPFSFFSPSSLFLFQLLYSLKTRDNHTSVCVILSPCQQITKNKPLKSMIKRTETQQAVQKKWYWMTRSPLLIICPGQGFEPWPSWAT